ncbi:MAG: sulfatase-like hydrolase/transferase [Planctomycetaceae bacterium]|nr:sulfatase-like hydrolase/transferase [Planctomycetaceae bacterium]
MACRSAAVADETSVDSREKQSPNIVILLADDLGYGDLNCYGDSTLQTPNIDRLAADGLRLTSCYASHPNCSPSRAGLLTGRTPFRLGIYNWIPTFSPMHLRRSEITIATLLRNSGYDTCHVGKWHLNGGLNLVDQPQPWDHGFSHWYAVQNNALPNHRDPWNFYRNGAAVGPQQGYSAELVSAEAVRWLKELRDPARPFFLFACFHEPHEPIASADRFTNLYPSDDPSYSAHHGNISQLDEGAGRVLKAIDELGQRNNTLVFFTSDNGPAITGMHPHGSAGPLRDKKGAIYDGGIRVPGIVRWPGHVAAGSVSDEPVCGIDMLPTICEIAEIAPPRNRTLDGCSFAPVFSGGSVNRTKPLYWQFNRARSAAKVAIRDGDWKLVAGLNVTPPSAGADITMEEMVQIRQAELTDFELYNLKDDVAEISNLASGEPEKLEELKVKMRTIFEDVRSEAPTWPAWTWPKYESQHIVWPEYWTNRRR